MTSPQVAPPEPLITGQQMSREEFLRRWELLPELKNAELIEGIVYVSSPVSVSHGGLEAFMLTWLRLYAAETPGCKTGGNTTWYMLNSAPQPDEYLAILPEFGGACRVENDFYYGAPELTAEVCISSTTHDFGPKLALYQRAGVKEYITVESFGMRVTWRSLKDGSYVALKPGEDGIIRSKTFPGLWLEPESVAKDDIPRMQEVLRLGLASTEHAAFVQSLKAKAAKS